MPPPPEALEARAEELVERVFGTPAPKRRMLVIANPYATTVSSRLKNLVVYALRGRYDVVAVETEAQDHATELCREAAAEGVEVVAAFGGDGTINEAANGLAGTDTALAVLPGGSTNVFCRTIGVPADVVDATEHLLELADRFEPRAIDLGMVDGRYFLFSSGFGFDAEVVQHVDSHPKRKNRYREWYFAWAAVRAFAGTALGRRPSLHVECDGREAEGVAFVAQNSDPYTYFGARAIRAAEGAGLDTGSLSAVLLKAANPLDYTLAPRLLSSRPTAVTRHRHILSLERFARARVRSTTGGGVALHVNGDYLGDREEVVYEPAPRALRLVS
jgi:diacylglycerol kinase family enzyme